MLYCLPLNKCKAFFSPEKATSSTNASAFRFPRIHRATISYTNTVPRCTTVNVSEIQTLQLSLFVLCWHLRGCFPPVGLYGSVLVIHCTGINKRIRSDVLQDVLKCVQRRHKTLQEQLAPCSAVSLKPCIIDFIQLALLWHGAFKPEEGKKKKIKNSLKAEISRNWTVSK